MIIVTGTKRAGTSMWMQILRASGIPVVGEAFPGAWDRTLKDANPHGFYESPFRRGIFYGTNPNPRTGEFMHPDDVQRHAVKVFVPGLVRTDLAYIGRVIGTVRNWREYSGSIARLQSIEVEGRERLTGKAPNLRPSLPPVLEWWLDNYSLLQDAGRRRYPIMLVTYEAVNKDPENVLTGILRWANIAPTAQALAAVKPESQTQDGGQPDVESELEQTFDELYGHLNERRPISDTFFKHLDKTHESLVKRIQAAMAVVRDAQKVHRAQMVRPGSPDWREQFSDDDESE